MRTHENWLYHCVICFPILHYIFVQVLMQLALFTCCAKSFDLQYLSGIPRNNSNTTIQRWITPSLPGAITHEIPQLTGKASSEFSSFFRLYTSSADVFIQAFAIVCTCWLIKREVFLNDFAVKGDGMFINQQNLEAPAWSFQILRIP